MKTSEMTPEQKQLLTDKLLRIAQIKKIDIIKMHRQVLVDVLNGEGHTRTVQETGKNLTKSGIGVTKVETYRSPAHNIQAVRLNRQLQDDWDKLVTELTPQPDLLARLLYHQGAEHEPDFYGEKVDVFVEGLLDCNQLPEPSSQTGMTNGGNKTFSKYPVKNPPAPDHFGMRRADGTSRSLSRLNLSGFSNAEDTNCQWDKDADETLQRIYNRKDDD